MSNLTEASSFDDVYQIETTDDVIGGPGGLSNRQPQQLANRTRWLKNRIHGLATVNVGVGADVTLAQAKYDCGILNLTGTPTAAINLVFPADVIGAWIIDNDQGGSYAITAKTAAVGGTTKTIPAGATSIIYSDGTNITLASSEGSQAAFVRQPITGITGATLPVTGGFTPGAVIVEKNGAILEPGDYSDATSPNITLNTAAVASDKFTVYVFKSFAVADAVAKSGDTMGGALILFGNAVNALGAVPKQQLDAAIAALAAAIAPAPGAFKNLQLSATCTNALVSVSYDALVLSDGAGNYATDLNASGTVSTAVSGAGGLDTGTIATSTWYSVWRIGKADGTRAWLLSLSATAPTMPSGYTLKARVGWIRTDGTANKYPLAFKQYGRRVQYVAAAGGNLTAVPTMASGTATVWTAVAVGAFVPATAAQITLFMYCGQNNAAYTAVAPNSSYPTGGAVPGVPIAQAPSASINVETSLPTDLLLESSNIYYGSNSSNSILYCFGWEDNL